MNFQRRIDNQKIRVINQMITEQQQRKDKEQMECFIELLKRTAPIK